MPRMPREIQLDQEAFYHLRGQVAGPARFYPLQQKENADQLLAIIREYTALYFCRVGGLEIMGSHYHLCCWFQPFRQLSPGELREAAERFYPGPYRPYFAWGPADWDRFNRRLFHVSELMRNIQQKFARWYNARHHRKGAFWAGRFQSTESDDLLETVYYVELNAPRKELVRRPEDWRYSSVWMRKNGQDAWLLPLVTLLDTPDPQKAEARYWANLYWRGTRASQETDAVIPIELALEMERQKIGRACYLERHDAFSRGRKIGSRETIADDIERWRQKGIYRRRRHPIPLGVANLHALRESRSNVRL